MTTYSAKEVFDAQIKAAGERLDDLQRSVTQREWLLICRTLDLPREQVVRDGGTRMLALAWVKGQREHGGAKWEPLLDSTDEDLLVVHGFPTEEPDEDAPPAPQEPATPEPDYTAQVQPPAPGGPLLPPRPSSSTEE